MLFLFLSCEKDVMDFADPHAEKIANAKLDKFRTKLENPYTIPNMQKAMDSLRIFMLWLGEVVPGRAIE